MSEHTKGRLLSDDDGVITDTEGRCIASVGCWDDPAGPARTIADTRRLAAAWNACEGMTTENLESIVFVGETIRIRFDFINAELRQAQAELNAARALLREVSKDGSLDMGNTNSSALGDSVRAYLDACDKPGEQNAS